MKIQALFAAVASLLFPTSVLAHFSIDFPVMISGGSTSTPDCGGGSYTSRTNVKDWPVGGSVISLSTTHYTQTWQFYFFKVSAPGTKLQTTKASVYQAGLGSYCTQGIPGISSWIGDDVVLQVVQSSDHGTLYGVSTPSC